MKKEDDKMRYFKYCLFLGSMISSIFAGYAIGSDISSSNWAVAAQPSVIERGFDKSSIAQFIQLLLDAKGLKKGSDIKEVHQQDFRWEFVEEITKNGFLGNVGDFCWADLDADGVYELLASVDYSGRGYFNNLYIVKQRGSTYTYQWLFVCNVERIDDVIEDLNKGWRGSMTLCLRGCKILIKDMDNDSNLELIIPIKLTEYLGAKPFALWTAIYKWNGEKFEEANEKFAFFYRTVLLPRAEQRIKELDEEIRKYQIDLDTLRNRLSPKMIDFGREELEESLAAEWIIRDKIMRLLGDEPLAGLERAKEWTKSPNINLRKNAIFVFKEIKNKESFNGLELLSQDSNPIVAQEAQRALDLTKEKVH